jgi:NAD(P)-dependent dehydrogenase (short-subunit alcohol dehydrogenase family)
MDLGLRGRKAIVASASKGLGRAVALELASEGAVCARSAANLRAAVAAIGATTGRTVYGEDFDITMARALRNLSRPSSANSGGWRSAWRMPAARLPRPSSISRLISVDDWHSAVELNLPKDI